MSFSHVIAFAEERRSISSKFPNHQRGKTNKINLIQ